MLPAINRILFATDLSANAFHAFGYAAGLAGATGAEIHVLHVVEALSDDARVTLMMFVQDEKVRRRALQERTELARSRLDERHEKFWAAVDDGERALRARVTKVDVIEGFAAEEILKLADSGHYSLIVVGAHEHGMSHSFLGNTAKRVLRRARIPTLIVPQRTSIGA